ncbi:DUF6879 family protein [Streptomyces griseus]
MNASMFACFRSGAGEVLQRPDYLADFSRVYESDIHLLAKLERGQTFKEPGTPSWEAFASGDWVEALRLIEDDRESVAAYFRDASQRGLTFRRLRVVEYPVTPYLQWEMNVLRLRSELGEEIRVLDAGTISDLERDEHVPEVVILGSSVMYAVIYDDDLKGAGARRFTDPDQIRTTTREFEALYAQGEEFSEFFEREIAPLEPPALTRPPTAAEGARVMNAELVALAQSAGTTLVGLMATDAWERTRDGVVAFWQRARPERADAVAAELSNTREDLAADTDTDTEGELAAEWQGRIRRLLTDQPQVAEELQRLLDELSPSTSPAASASVTQHASATGQSRVYQAGRDLHITEP